MGTSVETGKFEHYGQYAHDLYHNLRTTFEFVHKNLLSNQINMKNRWDQSKSEIKYNVGDYVYVWKPAPAHIDYRKFYNHWKGPYKIIRTVYKNQNQIRLDKVD